MTNKQEAEGNDEKLTSPANAQTSPSTPTRQTQTEASRENGGMSIEEDENEDEEEDDEDTEPKLKYNKLTGSLGPIYRNGDATSSCLVAGDKMITGTHNGNIHVISLPSFQSIRTYKAHSASITCVSVSPFPPPWPNASVDSTPKAVADLASSARSQTPSGGSTAPTRAPKPQLQIPSTPSNSIYIATSSIDGNVCVTSLVDPKDVMLRNFARPVQAVALSTEYKQDRTYLSGGLAGQLILTSGGKIGARANANTSSAAAAASGWLGSIGLGTNTGTDTVLHSGEGSISTIKWSLTGRYVLWVNEHGIKMMRTNLKLGSEQLEYAWERIGHIDKPKRKAWEQMANVWKPRAEWVNDEHLEVDEDDQAALNGSQTSPLAHRNASESLAKLATHNSKSRRNRPEKVVVGWGDQAWVIHVKPNAGRHAVGEADLVHKLFFHDCIISGVSLYTPSLIIILAYRTRDDDDNPIVTTAEKSPKRGVQHRQSGVQPELRLIEAKSGNEIDVDTLTVSRFEFLSASDYHLSTLYVPAVSMTGSLPRGALETLSTGFWDATASAGRIFSSGASVLSMPMGSEKAKTISSHESSTSGVLSPNRVAVSEPHPTAASPGLKIFIQSPYDCVLATKREPADRLEWLLEHEEFEQAYDLLSAHPEIVNPAATKSSNRAPSLEQSPPATPTRNQQSLADFFADSASVTSGATGAPMANAMHARFSAAEKEKSRIADLWLDQLTSEKHWSEAAKIAGRTLGSSQRWEHWVLSFAEAKQVDTIAPYIPPTSSDADAERLPHPPLPGLVYEVILGHYIASDRTKFKVLFERWDPASVHYDVSSVSSAIETKLQEREIEGGVRQGSADWQTLMEALGRLYVVEGRAKEALRVWVRCQNADEAIKLVKDYHLLGELGDDIRGFLTLRMGKDQLSEEKGSSLEDVQEASLETMSILVDEAYTGVVQPRTVIEQLQAGGTGYRPLIYLYLRALWTGDMNGGANKSKKGTLRGRERLLVDGRGMVEEFGDLTVEVFAEYDRDLLMQFLRNSQSYAFEAASTICENRGYTPELVYLLSKTGQTRRALSLITAQLADPSLAISFVKEQNDPELWDDLLDYSMDKPHFIRALLNEVGTSIDPIALVKRIPEGLEIEGLRDGIGRMVKEFEIQGSISEGVARVLRGEVATGQQRLREGRRRGVKFEVVHDDVEKVEVSVNPAASMVDPEAKTEDPDGVTSIAPLAAERAKPGHCGGCQKAFVEDEKDTLSGFACGHVFHLSCLLQEQQKLNGESEPNAAVAVARRLQDQLARDADADDGGFTRSVGAKTAHSRIIGSAIGTGGCPHCQSDGGDD